MNEWDEDGSGRFMQYVLSLLCIEHFDCFRRMREML